MLKYYAIRCVKDGVKHDFRSSLYDSESNEAKRECVGLIVEMVQRKGLGAFITRHGAVAMLPWRDGEG